MKTCSAEGCTNHHMARGYCAKHYWRLRTYGDASYTKTRVPGTSAKRDADGNKQCTKCEMWLPLKSYSPHPSTADRLNPICGKCVAAHSRFSRYGVNADWFERTVARQNGRCAICEEADVSSPYSGCVDHDHSCCPDGTSCGKCVRGVLCRRCNLMLGHALDSSRILQSAVEYLGRARDFA